MKTPWNILLWFVAILIVPALLLLLLACLLGFGHVIPRSWESGFFTAYGSVVTALSVFLVAVQWVAQRKKEMELLKEEEQNKKRSLELTAIQLSISTYQRTRDWFEDLRAMHGQTGAHLLIARQHLGPQDKRNPHDYVVEKVCQNEPRINDNKGIKALVRAFVSMTIAGDQLLMMIRQHNEKTYSEKIFVPDIILDPEDVEKEDVIEDSNLNRS